MKINAIDIKPGNVLEHQGKLWIVLKRDFVQPGKGGAFAQVEMRDLRSGIKLNDRFRTQETVERVRLDEKEMQFLYTEGGQATFMDNDTFEQVSIPTEMIGEPADFLRDGMICKVMLYEGTPLSVELPPSVVMEVVEADPVVRGQTASSSYKPGQARKRPSRHDPALYRGRHPHRRQHRRWQLHGAGEGLSGTSGEAAAMALRSPILNVMANAALKAARGLLRDFGEVEQLQVSVKGPGEFVSTADLKAERTLKAELTRARPGYGLLFEEGGAEAGTDPRHRWIVDPLDGTTNFLHGIPHFAISIALERDGEIVAGLIYDPLRDEMYSAEKGLGAYVNDRRLRVSARRQLGRCSDRHRHALWRTRRPPDLFDDIVSGHGGNERCASHGRGRARSCLCRGGTV